MTPAAKQTFEDLTQLLDRYKVLVGDIAATQHGLTRVQLFAIYAIKQRGELAMGKMADVLHCDASNVTGIVDRLSARELIVRQESANDRRTKTLRLTAKGEAIVATLSTELPMRLGCAKLSDGEHDTLHKLIQKILSS